jgi:TonB family protein
MGRIGLRRASLLFFCAAVATVSAPAAFAQARAPKIVPPQKDSAFPAGKDAASDSGTAGKTSEPAAPPSGAPAPPDGIARGGEGGITYPKCLRCPPALYSYLELVHKIQGNVTMDAVISADGHPSDIKILGSLGPGLDAQAVKAVRTWEWQPARDASGNPVAVHQIVVITFRAAK